jgi:excisionase family DNA binding protein
LWFSTTGRRAKIPKSHPKNLGFSATSQKTLNHRLKSGTIQMLARGQLLTFAGQMHGGTMRSAATRSNLLVPEIREVMDIRQASDYLGISPDTLYKYASEGFVPAFKLGNRWRFKRTKLDEWMDLQSELQAGPTSPDQKKPVRAAM